MGSKGKKEPYFGGSIGLSTVPVKGVTIEEPAKPREPTVDEMVEDLERLENRDLKREYIRSKIAGRTGDSSQKDKVERNPKRYLVDPETGTISVDEEEGELTYKDALLISASKKSKGGHFDEAVQLINAAKTLAEGNQPTPPAPAPEKKKEFYVDQETGIIVHDEENGEYTLSEARSVSQSMQRAQRQTNNPQHNYYVDQDGNLHQLEPGQPAVVKQQTQPQPTKTYVVQRDGSLQEQQPGQPIIVRVEQSANNSPKLPMAMDENGNPLFRNFDELISWKHFESEEKRADERHSGLMDLIQLSKENVPVAIQAIQRAVAEQGASEQGPTKPEPQTPSTSLPTHQCEKCGTNFGILGGEWAFLRCPGCGKKYSREELLGSSEGEQQ